MLESMQKIAILYDASQAILSTFDLDEVLNRILTIIRDFFQLQNGAVLLLDRNGQDLLVRAHLGRSNLDIGYRIPKGTGLTWASVEIKRPVYSPDVSKDPRYLQKVAETKSEVAIPLLVRDEVVGVLDFQSEQLNFFDSEMVDLLTLFSTQASLAL
ncbi:MAG TPA: GAF domain-containing protein, partial [Candidatus Angelobacter sp.]|nr:GAF domain-containing protein [Candidatus Angelobacter sp.]